MYQQGMQKSNDFARSRGSKSDGEWKQFRVSPLLHTVNMKVLTLGTFGLATITHAYPGAVAEGVWMEPADDACTGSSSC